MSKQITILIDPEDVNDLVINLMEIDEIEVQLDEGQNIPLDEHKQHPFYSLGSQDLTAILITIPAIITSLSGLVKVILDYKLKSKESKAKQRKTAFNEEAIIIDGKVIPLAKLAKLSTAEDLQKILKEEKVKEKPD